ncbi:MAG: DNA-3-methyladenine glycosylase family protein [Candidatus Thorarchaeota archaeon]
MEAILEVPAHYDLMASVHSWVYPDIQPVPETTRDSAFSRVFTIGNDSIAICLEQSKPGEPIRVLTNRNNISVKSVVSKLRWILNLNLNLEPVLRVFEKDPVLERIHNSIRGVRPYLADTPYEALIKSIIQQQISYKAANVITKKLVLGLGEIFENHETQYQFPSAERIVTAGKSALRSYGLGYKTDYLYDICELIEKDELQIQALVGLPYQDVYEQLIPLRGIGEWTIQALAIAGLGNFTVFPYSDLAVQKALGRLFSFGKRFSKNEVITLSNSIGENGPLVLYLIMCAEVLGFIG